jgi:hypothetical protein
MEGMMIEKNSKYTIWIEAESWAPGEWTPEDDNTDVIVRCVDGSRWIATFVSYQNVRTLAAKNRRSGENLSGAYLWIRDMILIDEVSRRCIEEVVNDLISTGSFETVFRSCADEEETAFEQK